MISFTDDKADTHTNQGNPVSISLSWCCADSSAAWLPTPPCLFRSPKDRSSPEVRSLKQTLPGPETPGISWGLRPKACGQHWTSNNSEGVKFSEGRAGLLGSSQTEFSQKGWVGSLQTQERGNNHRENWAGQVTKCCAKRKKKISLCLQIFLFLVGPFKPHNHNHYYMHPPQSNNFILKSFGWRFSEEFGPDIWFCAF